MSRRRVALRAVRLGALCAGVVLCAGAVSGCGAGGSHGSASHPRAGAEPAVAPPLTRAPAGRVVAVGAAAEGIVADPRAGLVAVAVRDPPRIAVLSARSGRVIRHIAIAGPARHLQLDGAATLLVPEAPINRLLELPLTGGGPPRRSIVTGSLPHDATASAGRVFVADEFGRAVSVIAGGRQVREIGGFTQPGGIAAVAGDVAVVDVGADVVTLIDARSERVLARAPAGAGPTHDAAGPDGRLYVADTRGDALLTFTTRPTLRMIDRLPIPGTPYGIASDPVHHRLWLTETAANTLIELDTSRPRPRIVATDPTVRQPNTVSVDPATGRVFVAGADAGVVQELDPVR